MALQCGGLYTLDGVCINIQAVRVFAIEAGRSDQDRSAAAGLAVEFNPKVPNVSRAAPAVDSLEH